MKLNFIFFISLFISVSVHSQDSIPTKNTLDNQFKTIYRKSTSYQEYKVISKAKYNLLHNNVLDSIKELKTLLSSKSIFIEKQKGTINQLEKEKIETTNRLKNAIKNEQTIDLFGLEVTKSTYSTSLFSLILILTIGLLYFIFKFKNSNVLTSKAKADLEEVEEEFNQFRKKSLTREQKLRRELQDEIIKNRNN